MMGHELEWKGTRVQQDKAGAILAIKRTGAVKWGEVSFRDDGFAGPVWELDGEVIPMEPDPQEEGARTGSVDGLRMRIEVTVEGGSVVLRARICNESRMDRAGLRAGIRLGVDCHMESYPHWNEKLFPTLLRCEKTHFWGYFMGPAGQILLVTSPEPVASYHLHYKPNLHRIYTASLDLLHPGPLPERHPQAQDSLRAGEERTWEIRLTPLDSLEEVKPAAARLVDAPLVEAELYTVDDGDARPFRIEVGDSPLKSVSVRKPDGSVAVLPFEGDPGGGYSVSFSPGPDVGLYRVVAKTENGKETEAEFAIRHPWSWYLKEARRNAVSKRQKGGSHTESWYGFYSAYLARKYFPDPGLDAAIDANFEEIWPLMYDMEKRKPANMHVRIQNHACAAGMFADRYRATGNPEDLEWAASLADFVVGAQGEDGGYYAVYGGDKPRPVHYTCVAYLAKSLLEVVEEERKRGVDVPEWEARAARHLESLTRAINDLESRGDDIQTEGEMTFEDGMISCSYTQLAMFALKVADAESRTKYADAALRLVRAHRCLSQLLVPDCRMSGGSLRFWESQYDVLTSPNMMSSPHGWSAWRVYGLWYLYQINGDEELLRQVYNTLGSACQLIDFDSGELRWAFIVDPYVEANQWVEDLENPGKGMGVDVIIGEQYLPMVSGWYKAEPGKWALQYGRKQDGGACDNDVHEIFKCLEETVLTHACVVEREEGEVIGYNCTVAKEGGVIEVNPSESVVKGVHFNLLSGWICRVAFSGGEFTERALPSGLGWIWSER